MNLVTAAENEAAELQRRINNLLQNIQTARNFTVDAQNNIQYETAALLDLREQLRTDRTALELFQEQMNVEKQELVNV